MRLRGLSVENFRAIARGAVLFGDTTILVGENDCGKTSLLRTVIETCVALARGAPTASDERTHAPPPRKRPRRRRGR